MFYLLFCSAVSQMAAIVVFLNNAPNAESKTAKQAADITQNHPPAMGLKLRGEAGEGTGPRLTAQDQVEAGNYNLMIPERLSIEPGMT